MKKILFVVLTLLTVSISGQAQMVKRGLKVKTMGTYTVASHDGSHDRVGSGLIGIGYQLNNYLYAGVEIGSAGPVDTSFDDPSWIVPMMADVQLSLPWNRFTPVCDMAFGGSAISFGNDTYKDSKYLIFDILPGLSFRINDWLSIQGNVGYEYRDITKGTGTSANGFCARLGLAFTLL